MTDKLSFRYDRDGKVLHTSTRPTYSEQETEELGGHVVERFSPQTAEIENLEVLFFSTRLLRSELFDLPVTAVLRKGD
jgi:hypothetical protein